MQQASSVIRALLPRLSAVLFILVFLSALSVGPKMLNIDGDLPRHLLMGKLVMETGNPPATEVFSYVYENRPYTPQEWLAGVMYYSVYAVLGLNGVVLLAGILIATSFTVLYVDAVSNNANRAKTFSLIILGTLVSSIHWVTRPHLFTMLFLAIWLILSDRLYRNRPVNLWIFPLLMVLWANIHGEFIAGFLVLLAYLAGWMFQYLLARSGTSMEIGKKFGIVTLASLAACFISPAGFRTWDIVFGYVTNRYLLSRIVETRPPNFTQPEYWPLLLLLGISIYLSITKKDRFLPPHFLLLAGFGFMSLLSARNAHLVGLVLPFVLSNAGKGITPSGALATLEAAMMKMESEVRGTALPIVLTLLVSAVLLMGPWQSFNRFESRVFPVDAVRWLEMHPQTGRMFNAFDWGGYILLHLWPEQKTFIESHTDVTGEATQKYETIITLQDGWQGILEQYDIKWAILPPDWPLADKLKAQGWETVHQDPTAVILVKR
ncbi:MAG TPA: hypothetical protein VIR02_16690 [Anaerolineales bacterium]